MGHAKSLKTGKCIANFSSAVRYRQKVERVKGGGEKEEASFTHIFVADGWPTTSYYRGEGQNDDTSIVLQGPFKPCIAP